MTQSNPTTLNRIHKIMTRKRKKTYNNKTDIKHGRDQKSITTTKPTYNNFKKRYSKQNQ